MVKKVFGKLRKLLPTVKYELTKSSDKWMARILALYGSET